MIKFAYAYEQATKHRRPPATTPPLPAATPAQQPQVRRLPMRRYRQFDRLAAAR